MRPALKSGLLPVWRDRDTLQIGIDPRRAIALSGMSQAALVVGLLDGSRDRDQVVAAAAARGIPVRATERILTVLAAAGVLDDFPASTLRGLPAPERARLASELATASLAHGDHDGGARCIARRRATSVRIDGDRRVAHAVARILCSSGVGEVRVGPPGTDSCDQTCAPDADACRPKGAPHADACRPKGAQHTDPGRPNGAPHADLCRPKGAQHTDPGSPNGAPHADLCRPKCPPASPPGWGRLPCHQAKPGFVVLVGRFPQDLAARLVADRIPHLAVLATEAIGVVGPLVIPGKTACLRCVDYARAGNDPAWPLILAQIATRRPDPPACDAVLTAAVSSQAAAQVLTALDKEPSASAAANGTLELVMPDWRWRRRSWSQHPACPCASHTVV
ncbi:MAG TPA: hypothetical protein VNF47_02345 [Streptosporangiaceae bacterium]|nr:hypothetical protein [Streptosporangiaceae bacterium]